MLWTGLHSNGIADIVSNPADIIAGLKGFINDHFSNDANVLGRDFEQLVLKRDHWL